ncbi:zona pellucida sperm-binding protein 3-like [Lepisosteus oculatus]|uniref:zona pellucida sperm-binding protein 3-like n=1 Tax=Lepisosteus oculatus TaxID=7918 RepID=UPI0035F50167
MVDSKADGCLSRFVPSKQKDVLRFTIDAFLFQKKLSRKHEVTELYMHCVMVVAPAKATPGTKSCTYNREAKRWEELYGDMRSVPAVSPGVLAAGMKVGLVLYPLWMHLCPRDNHAWTTEE